MPNFETRTLDSLTELRLDPFNPRLRKEEEGSSEAAIVKIMLDRFKVEEVAESITVAGWLEQDPLITVKEDGAYLVVEGNRRLTAVKLLLDPSLAPPTKQARWKQLAGSLRPAVRDEIKSLSVRVYPDRDDPEVSAYIGFRHVTGVLPWPALEKASYIARLASKGASYLELAEKLGSYPAHMARHHLAYQLVEQAQEWDIDGYEQMSNAFGVLLRALQTEGVRSFLELNPASEPFENLAPVPEHKKDAYKDFVKWTFGTDSQARVLPESRELTKWSKILLSPTAVRYLQNAEEPKFEKAWSRSGGESESIAGALWKASYLLADVVPLLSEHVDDPAVRDAAAEAYRYMKQIRSLLALQGEK
ncbi:ParB/RepB/Spo0J family partition protein [Microbacterium sp. SL75]|uniref:ParB/RepB/Spo0J family partition protein n=1 Tax=Microbacterium sp. SL75 TaxID=2995140 RepID=UPI0022721B23|nr:ParB/RepB/Spo0J family partition protein [Microbacterium sp. SL75]WAC70207.1 ParB/RepB/Spo0J family partition protein [Microbacterium sp. SL75]